jgi:hypothetical protein
MFSDLRHLLNGRKETRPFPFGKLEYLSPEGVFTEESLGTDWIDASEEAVVSYIEWLESAGCTQIIAVWDNEQESFPSWEDCYPDPWADDYAQIISENKDWSK